MPCYGDTGVGEMRISKYNKRVTIQQKATTRNPQSNQKIPSWETFKTVWAGIEYLQGNQLYRAKEINSEVQGRILIRHLEGLTSEMRVKYGDLYYEILWFDNTKENNKEIIIYFKKVQV